jgi:acetylornithine deacetylase
VSEGPYTVTGSPESRVLDAVENRTSEMVELLSGLIRMPSVDGSEMENSLQGHLAKTFEQAGLEIDHWKIPLQSYKTNSDFPGMEVDRTEAWGLVGRHAGCGDGPSLMFNGHIDVVPAGNPAAWGGRDPFSGEVSEGRVHGRGSCDMKGGLVAAYLALLALQGSGIRLRGDLILASVQGEEDGGLGTYALLKRGWRAQACVIPEPTGLDVVPANGGSLTFRLRITGLGAHASRRTVGVSAVEKFWPVFRALSELETHRNRSPHPLLERWEIAYPLSIGVVRAGEWASSVPDLLVAEGRLGVALGESPATAKTTLEQAVADVCASDPWLRANPVSVEWWGGQFASGNIPEDSDLPARMQAAHLAAAPGSAAPDIWGAPYGSDLRQLIGLGGIPTIQYGPGDIALAHAPNESVPIAEVVTCARALAMLALDFCGVADDSA